MNGYETRELRRLCCRAGGKLRCVLCLPCLRCGGVGYVCWEFSRKKRLSGAFIGDVRFCGIGFAVFDGGIVWVVCSIMIRMRERSMWLSKESLWWVGFQERFGLRWNWTYAASVIALLGIMHLD